MNSGLRLASKMSGRKTKTSLWQVAVVKGSYAALILTTVVCGFRTGQASADPSVIADRCTNQINYVYDLRNNAEINSISASTGICPRPQMYGPDAWSDPFIVGQSYIAYWARQLQRLDPKYGDGAVDSSDSGVCTRAVHATTIPQVARLDDDEMVAGCLDALKVG